MRVLLLTHTFNSLAQRLFCELELARYTVSVELDIHERVTLEAIELFRPDVIVAPLLKRRLPPSVFERVPCFIVHPGPPGDRGPSSLDWAIMEDATTWGVTALQATAELDGGPVWAWRAFAMRDASKGCLYRDEVADAATEAVIEALHKMASGGCAQPWSSVGGPRCLHARPLMSQTVRAIDWQRHTTQEIVRRLRAADGSPGVLDTLCAVPVFLSHGVAESELHGSPGELVATREGAACVATVDGAVWITHGRRAQQNPSLKLPLVDALGDACSSVPRSEDEGALRVRRSDTFQDIAWETETLMLGDGAVRVGYLAFDFYNGAMSTRDCARLRDAFLAACREPVDVIVLAGGDDFWSNGLYLHTIENALSPADESWRNINAMDDLAEAVLRCDDKLVVSTIRGNAGAGGVFLALTADRVLARSRVVLNPHYKAMGNLYGSEFWTYCLPKRVGHEAAHALTDWKLPMLAEQALDQGLVDALLSRGRTLWRAGLHADLKAWFAAKSLVQRLADKRRQRTQDEAARPLTSYREAELAEMHRNFYGFDPSYHMARHHFVFRRAESRTPRHLARHRQLSGPATARTHSSIQ